MRRWAADVRLGSPVVARDPGLADVEGWSSRTHGVGDVDHCLAGLGESVADLGVRRGAGIGGDRSATKRPRSRSVSRSRHGSTG
jgi:hypothetical protein